MVAFVDEEYACRKSHRTKAGPFHSCTKDKWAFLFVIPLNSRLNAAEPAGGPRLAELNAAGFVFRSKDS
jgi:hypothetical protein